MNGSLMFENPEFGKVRTVEINGEPYFIAKEIAEILGYGGGNSDSKALANAIVDHVDEEDRIMLSYNECKEVFGEYQNGDPTFKINSNGLRIINESGLYSLIISSKLPKAKQFKHWITSEVLPTIRKTGGYVSDDEAFINTYLPYADEETRSMFRTTLSTVRKQNEIIKQQKAEILHKEDVIVGLVDEISLAEKRQILNRVVRYNHANYRERWALLYREFENKYHIDLSRRLSTYNEQNSPKCRNKIDYIDRVLGKIPELYELAAKLYENDVKALVQEMYRVSA